MRRSEVLLDVSWQHMFLQVAGRGIMNASLNPSTARNARDIFILLLNIQEKALGCERIDDR